MGSEGAKVSFYPAFCYKSHMTSEEAIAEIAHRSKALMDRGAASAYLFGSTARGMATEHSDIDIFIDLIPNRKFSLIDLAGIQNYLERELKVSVDVTTRSSLHPMFKSEIEREAIQAY
jgi:uncharacterized protein